MIRIEYEWKLTLGPEKHIFVTENYGAGELRHIRRCLAGCGSVVLTEGTQPLAELRAGYCRLDGKQNDHRFLSLGKNNRLKLIRLEHNSEKKSRLVAINTRRFGGCISKVHPKRIFEFIQSKHGAAINL